MRLVRYVLTIIKAYLNEGAPTISNKRFKSFPDQDKLCRQPLLWLGMKDPLMRTLKAQEEDPDKVAFASLLKELRMAFKNKRFTTFDIKKVIQENPDNRVKWDGILSQLELNTSEDESSAYLGKLCKIRNFSQSPFGGFISEESDGNFPSGRN